MKDFASDAGALDEDAPGQLQADDAPPVEVLADWMEHCDVVDMGLGRKGRMRTYSAIAQGAVDTVYRGPGLTPEEVLGRELRSYPGPEEMHDQYEDGCWDVAIWEGDHLRAVILGRPGEPPLVHWLRTGTGRADEGPSAEGPEPLTIEGVQAVNRHEEWLEMARYLGRIGYREAYKRLHCGPECIRVCKVLDHSSPSMVRHYTPDGYLKSTRARLVDEYGHGLGGLLADAVDALGMEWYQERMAIARYEKTEEAGAN